MPVRRLADEDMGMGAYGQIEETAGHARQHLKNMFHAHQCSNTACGAEYSGKLANLKFQWVGLVLGSPEEAGSYLGLGAS